MKIKTTAEIASSGHKYIRVNHNQLLKALHNQGICDQCNKHMFSGYIIPIKNGCYCRECFVNWQKDAVLNKEDIDMENTRTIWFLEQLNN